MKRRVRLADSEREGMAKRVMGVGETSGLLLVSPGPQLLLGGDTPNKTQDWVQEEVGSFLFGDPASPIFFQTSCNTGEGEDCAGHPGAKHYSCILGWCDGGRGGDVGITDGVLTGRYGAGEHRVSLLFFFFSSVWV